MADIVGEDLRAVDQHLAPAVRERTVQRAQNVALDD
jgi:hypothetical protein